MEILPPTALGQSLTFTNGSFRPKAAVRVNFYFELSVVLTMENQMCNLFLLKHFLMTSKLITITVIYPLFTYATLFWKPGNGIRQKT